MIRSKASRALQCRALRGLVQHPGAALADPSIAQVFCFAHRHFDPDLAPIAVSAFLADGNLSEIEKDHWKRSEYNAEVHSKFLEFVKAGQESESDFLATMEEIRQAETQRRFETFANASQPREAL